MKSAHRYKPHLFIVSALGAIIILGYLMAKPPCPWKKSCQAAETNDQQKADHYAALFTEGSTLLDVRTSEEYAAGHIEGAIHLSLQDIQQGTYPNTDKSAPLYVYCRSGNRSQQAATILKEAGYLNVIDLGAIDAVQAIGGKIIQ